MEFIYTTHAEENIDKRRLDKSVIEATIRNPEATEISSLGRRIAQRIISDKLLRVVYEKKEQNVYIVITAYYTEKDRYR
jgi:hypothetical protein